MEKKLSGLSNNANSPDLKLIWSIYSQSPIPVFIRNTKTGENILYNNAMFKLTGYNLENVPNMETWIKKIYPDRKYQKFVKDLINKTIQKQLDLREYELVITRKDGNKRYVEFSVYNIYQQEKFSNLQIIQGLDVTDRKNRVKELKELNDKLKRLNSELDQRVKKRTKKLQESENRLRMALEGANEGLWVIDFVKDTMVFTTQSAKMLGYSLEELGTTSEKWDIFTHPDDWPHVEKSLIDHFEGRSPYYECEYRVKTKSGEWKWIMGHGRVIKRDSDGKPLQAIGTHVDITKLKEIEIELRKSEKELRIKTQSLEEINTALRVLLERREADKTEIEKKVLLNVKDLVIPYMEKLESTRLTEKQKSLIGILKSNLNDIVSPFTRRLAATHMFLTPREIQVADLIKKDKSTKEIAELLIISESSVGFHRHHIRRKLGLLGKKVNLKTYLLSFQ